MKTRTALLHNVPGQYEVTEVELTGRVRANFW